MNNQNKLSDEDLVKLIEACEVMLTKFQLITETKIEELKKLLRKAQEK